MADCLLQHGCFVARATNSFLISILLDLPALVTIRAMLGGLGQHLPHLLLLHQDQLSQACEEGSQEDKGQMPGQHQLDCSQHAALARPGPVELQQCAVVELLGGRHEWGLQGAHQDFVQKEKMPPAYVGISLK